MAGASAGHMAKKSSGRFKVLRTVGKTKNRRKETKAEIAADSEATKETAAKFKRSIAAKKGATNRAKNSQGSLF